LILRRLLSKHMKVSNQCNDVPGQTGRVRRPLAQTRDAVILRASETARDAELRNTRVLEFRPRTANSERTLRRKVTLVDENRALEANKKTITRHDPLLLPISFERNRKRKKRNEDYHTERHPLLEAANTDYARSRKEGENT